MASRRSRAPSTSRSPSPRVPPAPRDRSQRRGDDFSPPRQRRRRSRQYENRGYNMRREKDAPEKIDLLFCVFGSATSTSWRTAPYTFDRRRITDTEIWEDIRGIYRDELQTLWRRILLFKRLKFIAPITVSSLPIVLDGVNLASLEPLNLAPDLVTRAKARMCIGTPMAGALRIDITCYLCSG